MGTSGSLPRQAATNVVSTSSTPMPTSKALNSRRITQPQPSPSKSGMNCCHRAATLVRVWLRGPGGWTSPCEREELRFPIGTLATDFAWLPGPDGEVHRAEEFTLDDLPPGFKRDEALAAALGKAPPFIEEPAGNWECRPTSCAA
jgi:hypothetical protein